MKIPFLDLKAQYFSIKKEIDQAIQNVIADTAFVKGKYVTEFEQNFANQFDVKHCIGVGNGTDAISLALKALGLKIGDEVITAANSFVATSEAITNVGGKVVFVDCDPETYTIDVNQIEANITEKTKGIIPVHLYGNPANMDIIMGLAEKYQLFVVEDNAQGHLSEFRGQKTGTFGHIATYSFYPGKNLGAYGDAGAVVTNDDLLAKKVRMYANHGRTAKYDHEFEGMNSRMDGIQGAVLNVKLKYLEKWTNQRIWVAQKYKDYLKDVDQLVLPKESLQSRHVYHLYVVRTQKRDALAKFLEERGVQTGIHYPIALPNLSAYKYLGYSPMAFPIADSYQDLLLSLPVYPEMTEEMIQYVADNIKEFFL
ncbi:MAG: DegT/DnrJ/EryC1/StrS family aminotransferase [Bacteroidales bacterium]|nr:DegT/DnrJ/EryC1/StrS family aminotransferase [Bacteroidales bacterium]